MYIHFKYSTYELSNISIELLSKPMSLGQLYRSIIVGSNNDVTADHDDDDVNVTDGGEETGENKADSNTPATPRYMLYNSAVYGLPHVTLIETV